MLLCPGATSASTALVNPGAPDVAAAYQPWLVLVRADGHVAWRDDALPDDPAALLDTVRGAGTGGPSPDPGAVPGMG